MQDQSQQGNILDRPKIPSDYKIRVLFRGFLITRINSGETAWLGALSSGISLCHRPNIRVYKLFPPSGTSGPDSHGHSQDVTPPTLDPEADISLLADPVTTGIQLFQTGGPDFNRLDERNNSRKDFRWFLSLKEVHREPVGVVESQITPRFRINQALFHTSDRSEGELRVEQGDGSPHRHFGRFALELSARVYLTQGSASCVGNVALFEPISATETRFKYDVVYDCSCRVNEDVSESDFRLIYQAIRVSAEAKKVKMMPEDPEDLRTASPEVYCTGGNTFP